MLCLIVSFYCKNCYCFDCIGCDRGLKKNINAEPNGEVDYLGYDGVHTGFDKRYVFRITNPKKIWDEEYIITSGSRFGSRYITKRPQRKRLKRLLQTRLGKVKSMCFISFMCST